MPREIAEIVRDVLTREDIEGLLSLGAPPDEYKREAELVGQAIQRIPSKAPELHPSTDQVAGVLREVWNRTFGPYSEGDLAKREPAFRRAASEIVKALQGVTT